MLNVNPASALKVVATIDPATITGAEVFSDAIDMGIWESVLAVLSVGNSGGGTVDFKVYQCAYDGSAATAAIKSIVQWTDSSSTNDNAQAVMAFRADEMPAAGTKRFCKFGLTIGSTGGPAAVVVLGIATRYSPAAAKQADQEVAPSLASVKETKL